MNTITHTDAREVTRKALQVGDVVGGKGTGLGARRVTAGGTLEYPRTGKPAPETLASYVRAGKVTVTGKCSPMVAKAPKAKPAKVTRKTAKPSPVDVIAAQLLTLGAGERTLLANLLGDSLV